MSAISIFQKVTKVLNELSTAAVSARSEVQKLLTVLEGPSLMTDTIAKNARNEDGTEWNVFEKDQGKERWPDVPSYPPSMSHVIKRHVVLMLLVALSKAMPEKDVTYEFLIKYFQQN